MILPLGFLTGTERLIKVDSASLVKLHLPSRDIAWVTKKSFPYFWTDETAEPVSGTGWAKCRTIKTNEPKANKNKINPKTFFSWEVSGKNMKNSTKGITKGAHYIERGKKWDDFGLDKSPEKPNNILNI
jgi:hypothetical protein